MRDTHLEIWVLGQALKARTDPPPMKSPSGVANGNTIDHQPIVGAPYGPRVLYVTSWEYRPAVRDGPWIPVVYGRVQLMEE